MNYSSTYRGAGRNGYVYTTTRMHGSSASMGMAQAPTASMGTTSAYGSTIGAYGSTFTSPKVGSVRGIRTSAEGIRGGVTTYGSVNPYTPGKRRADADTPPSPADPGYCDHCHYHWDPDANAGDGDWVCDECGRWLTEGCKCDPCHCPIGDGWQVMLFLGIMAAVYAMYKKHNARREELA